MCMSWTASHELIVSLEDRTYPVTGTAVETVSRGTSTKTHERGNVIVAADGAVDFDTGLAQTAKSITE